MMKIWSGSQEGSVVLTPDRVEGMTIDFDDTITNPSVRLNGKRVGLHDISRVATAQTLGIKWNVPRLISIDYDLSQRSYKEAAEPTLEGSIVWLFKHVGIFDSLYDYDRGDPRIQEFKEMRETQHTQVLKNQAQLNPGAEELLKYVTEETEHGLAIASMANMNDIDIVFDRFHLGKYVSEDRIISREKIERPKPDRQVNDFAFHALKTGRNDLAQRQRIIGVDDSIGGLKSVAAADLYPIGLASNLTEQELEKSPANVIYPTLWGVRRFIINVNSRAA